MKDTLLPWIALGAFFLSVGGVYQCSQRSSKGSVSLTGGSTYVTADEAERVAREYEKHGFKVLIIARGGGFTTPTPTPITK